MYLKYMPINKTNESVLLTSIVTSLTVSHTGFTEHIIIKGKCGDCRFPVFWGYVWGVILDQQWGVK